MHVWQSASMSRRFALGAAGLAAAAVLLISLASWWLINRSHLESVRELAAAERQFRAEAVGSDLQALAERMQEMSQSTILASGLVDSSGRETYLAPFLAGIRQISGVPVHVVFTDFEGREIASNGTARFSDPQLDWLRARLAVGQAGAAIFDSGGLAELVALAPMRYDGSRSPDGALFYKVAIGDLYVGEALRLHWSGSSAAQTTTGGGAAVPVPPVFEPLGLAVHSTAPPAARLDELAPQYLSIALIAATLFAAVVLVGAKLAKMMTRDLHRLQTFSSRFLGSALGEQRAPIGGSREVSSLAESINAMLDRLDEQHSALLQEREKLKRSTDALQLADRRKDDFLAMLAHELRNPLAPILNGAELLKRLPGSDPRLLRTSDVIARQAQHMREILEDLLDVSRVTRGLITLDREPQDLAHVARMAVEQVRPLIDARGHRLEFEIEPGPRCVLGDRSRLIQIVTNLLTNAAKYTPPGGRIQLRIDPAEAQVRITVQDDGEGIAPELMPELFDLFSQGSRAVDRKQGGLGLGLALVRQLVELHGGSVQACSAGEGGGSTFTVMLPLHAAAQTPPDGTGTGTAATQVPHRLQIMLVDDNVDAAVSLAATLELDGHAVQVVHDARSALRLLDDEPARHHDAFLLDIGLPGMDGYELARALRKRAHTRHARLIAITGYGQPEDRLRAFEAGFDHHLVKPVDTDALARLLQPAAPAPAGPGAPVPAGALHPD